MSEKVVIIPVTSSNICTRSQTAVEFVLVDFRMLVVCFDFFFFLNFQYNSYLNVCRIQPNHVTIFVCSNEVICYFPTLCILLFSVITIFQLNNENYCEYFCSFILVRHPVLLYIL